MEFWRCSRGIKYWIVSGTGCDSVCHGRRPSISLEKPPRRVRTLPRIREEPWPNRVLEWKQPGKIGRGRPRERYTAVGGGKI